MTAPATIDQYIDAQPESCREILQTARKVILDAAPDAEEAMAYGIPTFRLGKTNLVHVGMFKNHLGFYPSPSGIEAFKEQVSRYKWAKGSVQFPLEKPIPWDLIEAITRFRVQEIEKSRKK